ncbi:hypothetical protein [Anaerosporobacter faecicola]|uniref:hypothetical protein n=1 Tax=Anaerosporobacter faecicola TaxID=2718714 RepID=UPI001439F7DC|nr:hypothetical protein [Anaerosporobacter faecicola]
MNNKLIDLNNHLFAEMERLGDEELSGENLEKEIERAKAITSVASQIIANGALALKAEQFKSDIVSSKEAKVPKFLEGE